VSPRKTALLVATTNRGKAREIAASLAGLPVRILSLADVGLEAVCPENGKTFEANARAKAEFYSRLTGRLTLAEDSGLEIKALQGAPGVRSARFSEPGATDPKNIEKALRLLASVPRSKRRARFVCAMALARDGRTLDVVHGRVSGTIAFEKRGVQGFGYDPIFYYHPFRKSFGELTPEAKNAISHRGRALAEMKSRLARFLPE
jgi:XTP/dITP diphosphohydrolase